MRYRSRLGSDTDLGHTLIIFNYKNVQVLQSPYTYQLKMKMNLSKIPEETLFPPGSRKRI